ATAPAVYAAVATQDVVTLHSARFLGVVDVGVSAALGFQAYVSRRRLIHHAPRLGLLPWLMLQPITARDWRFVQPNAAFLRALDAPAVQPRFVAAFVILARRPPLDGHLCGELFIVSVGGKEIQRSAQLVARQHRHRRLRLRLLGEGGGEG